MLNEHVPIFSLKKIKSRSLSPTSSIYDSSQPRLKHNWETKKNLSSFLVLLILTYKSIKKKLCESKNIYTYMYIYKKTHSRNNNEIWINNKMHNNLLSSSSCVRSLINLLKCFFFFVSKNISEGSSYTSHH